MSLVTRLRDMASAARIGEVTPPPELFEWAADELSRLYAYEARMKARAVSAETALSQDKRA